MKQKCEQCGEEWFIDFYPVCPKCNHQLLHAIQQVDERWLYDPNRYPEDVLTIRVTPNYLQVTVTNVNTGKVKVDYKAFANPSEMPYRD